MGLPKLRKGQPNEQATFECDRKPISERLLVMIPFRTPDYRRSGDYAVQGKRQRNQRKGQAQERVIPYVVVAH